MRGMLRMIPRRFHSVFEQKKCKKTRWQFPVMFVAITFHLIFDTIIMNYASMKPGDKLHLVIRVVNKHEIIRRKILWGRSLRNTSDSSNVIAHHEVVWIDPNKEFFLLCH